MSLCFCWGRQRALTAASRPWRTGGRLSTPSKSAYATAPSPPAEIKTIVRTNHNLHLSFSAASQTSYAHRSILRAVLREASYLPDPNARQFVKQKALHHSRKHAFRVWERRDDPDFAERNSRDLHRDRNELRRLRRANEGERKPLLYILLRTYGRTGARRYDMLQPLLPTMNRDAIKKFMSTTPLSATEPEAFSPTSDSIELSDGRSMDQAGLKDEQSSSRFSGFVGGQDESSSTSEDTSVPTLTPELYALAKSQKENQPPTLTRKNPRQLKPSIPALNARMRPMPRKRVRNMTKKWYAYLLNCILPPLPTKEWEQLRDWANGKNLPLVDIPRRSSRLSTDRFRHFGKYSALEAIVIQGRIDKGVYGNREVHAITPRFMQRLWATVFSTCPHMIYDNATNEWNVLWGHQELAAPTLDDINEIAESGGLEKVHFLRTPGSMDRSELAS